MEELRLFQQEIIEARSGTWDQRRARALDLLDRYYTGGHVQKAVALELLFTLRDCTDWTTTLQFIDSLPDDLRNLPQVKEQWALAQSKTGDHLLAIEALSQLIHLHGETSERRGLLGGRYRKLWVSTPPGPEKTRYLNKAINEYEHGMMLDLNDYYPSSNLPRLYRVRGRKGDEDKARTASGVTMLACTRARMTNSTKDEWLLPTLLGAAFDAGDVEAAREFAAEIQMEGPASWKLESTLSGLDLAIGFHDADRAHELGMILSELKRLL
jgi:hypothetical protein